MPTPYSPTLIKPTLLISFYTQKVDTIERDEIAVKFAKGLSICQIVNDLGRSKSSISDEIKRNSYHGVYVAIQAQHKSDKRKKLARYKNRYPLKNILS